MAEIDLKKVVEDLGVAFEEFKAANDEALESKAPKGVIDTVLTEKIEKIQNTLDEKSAIIETAGTELKSANDRIDELETIMDRSGHGEVDQKAELELRSHACEMILIDLRDQGNTASLDLRPADVDAKDLEVFANYDKYFDTYLRRGAESFMRKMGPGVL